MRIITLEEHFATPAFLDGPGREMKEQSVYASFLAPLCDIGAGRIAAMDEAGIDAQLLSLTAPGLEQAETADALAVARDSNDVLAAAVKANPTRFAGLAALAVGAPNKAAEELQRRVTQDGFKGAVINGQNRGRYLDDKFYWPILEAAEALNVPIHIHPAKPPKAVIEASYGGFSPEVTEMFAGPGWGWHIETAVHVLRMILGGAFDRFPKLNLLIGHLGEGLIFMIQRVDSMPPRMTGLQHPVSHYLRNNIYYTVSGFNFPSAFLALLLEMGGVERIMFSADHPYGSMARARAFLEQLPVTTADRERIAHGNAERVLGI
jgi:predicted TIM-barrel fold metal-dependent hydrolase